MKSVRNLALLTLVLVSFMVGCGGGDDGDSACFARSDFLNGTNITSEETYWRCIYNDGTSENWEFYSDNTFYFEDISVFGVGRYSYNGCNTINIALQTEDSSSQLMIKELSRAAGTMSLEVSIDIPDLSISANSNCTLRSY